MADGLIQVPPDSTGKKVDAASLDVGANTVYRQRMVLASDTGTATFATIVGSTPGASDNALVVRNIPSGTQTVTGAVGISGTAICSITSMVGHTVSGTVALAAGTANIGTINGISATVTVVNAAGSANIGSINNISATVTVAGSVSIVGAVPISGTVALAAGSANIGTVNAISATVNVAFAGGIALAAGSANIGTINNISATVSTGLSYVIEKTTNSQVQVGDSANAAIRVNIVAGAVGGSGGTSIADRAAFTEATTLMTVAGGVFSDTRSAVAEDAAAALRITTQAGLHVNLRTDGGVAMDDSANSALRVNIVAGAGSGGTAAADRSTFTEATTSLTPAGGVFSDTRSAIAEDKVAALRLNAQAGLHVNLRDVSGADFGVVGNPISVKVERQSATASVVIAAGTANIGTVNAISATVNVALASGVTLAAGTANIGTINNISAAVAVTIAAALNISAMPAVALAAGSANIGSINNISATVTVALVDRTAIMSGSHGPRCVVCSTSAATSLIATPGAGQSIYVTQLTVSNMGTAAVVARVGTSASAATVQMGCQSAGGGFVMQFDPPWKLSASEAAICSVNPNSSGDVYFNVNFYVAP